MAKTRPSVLKRQREQAKRDKKAAKAGRREQRLRESQSENTSDEPSLPPAS